MLSGPSVVFKSRKYRETPWCRDVPDCINAPSNTHLNNSVPKNRLCSLHLHHLGLLLLNLPFHDALSNTATQLPDPAVGDACSSKHPSSDFSDRESSSSFPMSKFLLGSCVLSLNLNIRSLIIFIYPNILIYLNISQYILIYLNTSWYLNWCICILSEHFWILCFSPSLVSPVSRPLLVLVLLFQLSNLVLELAPGVSRNQYFSYQPGTWHIHFKNACFGWMITNLHIKNGCLTKHPLETGCLGFQEGMLKKNPWMTICGCADIYLWFPGSCGFMVAANCAPKILSSQVATPHKLEGSESLFKQLSGSFLATSRNIWKNHEKSDKSASSALVAQVVCKTFDVFSEPKESSTISNV